MIFEKQQGAQNTIKKIIVDGKKTSDQTHILAHRKEFYEILFKKREQKTAKLKVFSVIAIFQNSLKIKQNFFEEDLTEKKSIGFSKKHSR